MSLTTRVSAFFLISLAVVLASFSGALYLLARIYLVRQLDERLELSLDTLEASVDIEPVGLEWEPADRKMELGVDTGINDVRWSVRDEGGRPVDCSLNSRNSQFPSDWSPPPHQSGGHDVTVFGTVPGWRLACRTLHLSDLLRQGRGHPDDEPGYEVQYQTLVLLVGLAPSPVEASLSRLALTLTLLSATVWVTAAVTGRWLCSRALAPVSQMARAAAAMTADDLADRLPTLNTGDELDELGRAYNEMLDRLQDSFGRLRDAYEQQRQFAGNASHQLRTPLAALLGQVQIARRRDRSPEEYRRVLDLVQEEATRLRQIVETLLDLARPATGRLQTEIVDLGAWIANHVLRWTDHPRWCDIRIETDHGPLEARINIHLFAQLFDNLLENAFKYSPPGSPVLVRARNETHQVALSVEDRGCGLDPEDLGRVFEPFYRSEQARRVSKDGLGLGLAVARRISLTFGGTLDVNGQPGEGCVFTVRLPKASHLMAVEDQG